MLLSVHLPKTAGTSFREALREQFGERLVTSYADRPLHQTKLRRRRDAAFCCVRNALGKHDQDIACLHGHFLPLKYRFMRATSPYQFVTWMREPLQRLLSHYYYWQRSYEETNAGPLHRRMMQEDWSLEEFGLRPELRNIYSEFLWGFPLEAFAFIGITEHFEDDLGDFSRRFLQRAIGLGTDAAITTNTARINVNPTTEDAYVLEGELRSTLEQYHARDIALYRRALAMRSARLAI